MVTYKLALDERRAKQDGTYPLVVRVTFDRKVTNFQTGIYLSVNHWDKTTLQVSKQNPNWSALSLKATDEYVKVQKAILTLENEDMFSFEALKEKLTDKLKPLTPKANLIFKDFALQLIDELLSINKSGNAIVYRTALNRFMNYVGNPKLKLADVDYQVLNGFKNKLTMDGVKQNTIRNYFRTLRAIYNRAIKAKLIDRSQYPFLDISIKSERTSKRAISVDDLRKIFKHNLTAGSRGWHARNYFFLSFSLRGASFTDIAYLTKANIKNGRLLYKRRKTGKELNIKLLPYTEMLLKLYFTSNTKYLLPILENDIIENSLEARKVIGQWIKSTNYWLNKVADDCNLNCDITTYVARHSWATTAKRLGFSIEVIAEAMGHEHGNRITNIYLDSFDQELIDDVNLKVISTLNF